MKAILGKKVGMTSFFNPEGRFIPVTVIEAGPNIVTQVKTKENDGYNAVQIGFEQAKTKHTSNAMAGHFKRAGVPPMTKLMEFRDFEIASKVGDSIEAGIFAEGDKVSVSGVSKGKGFQGVVRRHGFSGVGMATHGQHNRLRAPGSVGASSFPSRVFKGMRMAGRMGNDTVKVKNLRVQKVMPEKNLILVRGSIPGAIGSYVIVQK